jgi:hypothetical protein
MQRQATWTEWVVLGAITLCCFVPANSAPLAGVSGWEINIAGMIGVAAIFQWQRMRPKLAA